MQTLRCVAKAVSLRTVLSVLSAALAVSAVITWGQPTLADNSTSRVQSLLFDNPYLTQLALPSSLTYTYNHRTSEEKRFGKAFTDTISIDVAQDTEHANSVSLRIFTGPRERRLGPHHAMKGNPIIMIFLEHDLWETKHQVGGVPVYYRNKIRKALREAAQVSKIQSEFGGKLVPAHRVTITPFKDEKDNHRLREFLNKSYEFTVSDAVPGGYLKVRSIVPDGDTPGAFLVEDELSFLHLK